MLLIDALQMLAEHHLDDRDELGEAAQVVIAELGNFTSDDVVRLLKLAEATEHEAKLVMENAYHESHKQGAERMFASATWLRSLASKVVGLTR